jgi:SAM-dependent methyltransferase
VLVRAFDRVIAVEPQDAMRRVLHELCPGADVRSGTADAIPLPDGTVDGAFVAQAFHWFDNERALGEIARVLRPGGALVVMWNAPAGPWEPSTADAEELLLNRLPNVQEPGGYDPLDLGSPRYASGEWRRVFARSPFGELREARLPNPQTVDRDGLVAFFASMGWIAEMPDAGRLPLLDGARALLGADEYRRPWETHVHWTRLSQ